MTCFEVLFVNFCKHEGITSYAIQVFHLQTRALQVEKDTLCLQEETQAIRPFGDIREDLLPAN